ncbi:type I restriction-modification system subunit M [Balneola sp. EhC07]|uniref:type I restriction-modification system subunit M n=1 Tax=Balneola sp. EhC07 TaxID=1849360 RepID=UPI0007F4E6E0|nr:type I restriction-modification system subunit M [Balneola sp. EhC07]OAN62426.1 type I restriction-modification system subunit M [Balneola sp. EhC07]
MPIKKSDLYASIWKSCDELRGGMDASQYKDYVLSILFIKYVSDKYADAGEYAPIVIPDGSSFQDMIKLKGQVDIGDQINKKIIAPLAEANDLRGVIDQTDFNDDEKLGSGKEKVNRLSNLIGIFQDANLDFGGNNAGDDDLLGDAYEYLMRNFATESGKSKGQFYTPAEVSRILANVIGVEKADNPSLTAYDPTAGSGSLILKVADEAPVDITIYGQEMDVATTALAKMNMVLHNRPEAVHDIMRGNTLADPKFSENGELKRFDYVVANPPFSYKSWTNGLDPKNDLYNRFEGFGIPPTKNGDYAFLLHIVKSLKNTGTAAVILPHGVLFRGNAEGKIRQNLIERGYIKGIIGLPANLFYGTGIPACILVLDKEQSGSRDGIFMIDGSEGYIKDGNKNRLRERDIHKIVDVFREQKAEGGFSRFVPNDEIQKNEFNLNIPRYIDNSTEEDIQDIEGHLKGGIPMRDVEGMNQFWDVYPGLKDELFSPLREGYLKLKTEKDVINEVIFSYPAFVSYSKELAKLFTEWKQAHYDSMKSIDEDVRPKALIAEIAEDLLKRYRDKALIDPYDIYQHLMNYWSETMRDDVYIIVEDGWTATLEPVRNSKGNIKKGEFTCELIPKELVINRYFPKEHQEIEQLKQQQEEAAQVQEELEQEHAVEGGLLEEALSDAGNVTKGELTKRMKEIKGDEDFSDEFEVMKSYKTAYDNERKAKSSVKKAEKELDKQVIDKYKELTEDEVQTLVVDDKWLPTIKFHIDGEVDAISRSLTQRVNELAGRYDKAVVEIDKEADELETRVQSHLEAMGVV